MAHRPHIWLMACALAAAPLAATAEEAPGCWWDEAALNYSPTGDLPAWSSPAGNNFATTFVDHEAGNWNILYHCPSDAYLVTFAPSAAQERINARYTALLEADEPYTLSQIGEQLAALGAQARTGKGDLGSCPCDHLKSINALK